MKIERRVLPLQLREAVKGSNGRQRWATAVTYGTVDDYGSTWSPGVFTEALSKRMPTILYGHDWYNLDHVLGQGIDSREMDYGVDVLMEFADPDEIESARAAMYLVGQRIIKDVSVGFERYAWRDAADLTEDELKLGAREAIDRAGMDELSLVVRGAVPGAGIRSRLGRRGFVDLDAIVEIARRKSAGELSDAEAQEAVTLLVVPDDVNSAEGTQEDTSTQEATQQDIEAAAAEAAALDADVAAALAIVADRSRPH
jgi:hypothetical protein